jgi:hypothetical protein
MASGPEHYSAQRATAVHEAGHAVMGYLLGIRFTQISVVEEAGSLGRVAHKGPGEWFRPDIEVDSRVRNQIEKRVMTLLAGAETERAWYGRLPDAPVGWHERVDAGARGDQQSITDLAYYIAEGPELDAYLEWLRQRVLNFTGRGAEFDVARYHPDAPAFEVRHYIEGSERFWTLVTALADAVQEVGTLSWRRARQVLRTADPLLARVAEIVAKRSTANE